jgi:hypothetical protein
METATRPSVRCLRSRRSHRSGRQLSQNRHYTQDRFLSCNPGEFAARKLGSNLGPFTAEYRVKPWSETQNQAKRINNIGYRLLLRDQGVGGSSPLSPTTIDEHSHKLTNLLHQRVVTRFKKEKIGREAQTVWKERLFESPAYALGRHQAKPLRDLRLNAGHRPSIVPS